jgi:thiosulfate reductase cytochrome b subunit
MPEDPERPDAPRPAEKHGVPAGPPPEPATPPAGEEEGKAAASPERAPADASGERDSEPSEAGAERETEPAGPPTRVPLAAPARSAPAAAAAEPPGAEPVAPVGGPTGAAAPPPEATASRAVRPFVRRHHWIVRLTHWVNTVVLLGMMGSGLQIYTAYERFGIRGTKLPLPNPLDMQPAPHWARLGGWLAGGLNWHFFLMWPLVLNGLLYLGYLIFSGEWRPLLFRPRDVGPAIEMQKYYLRLRREHPRQGKHNALQKGAYSFIVLLGVLSVLSGLALYKPIQLPWLTALFGGYELARYWHFVAVWLFAAFIVVHVVLVFVVDPASLRAMITGWYRGRFPSRG